MNKSVCTLIVILCVTTLGVVNKITKQGVDAEGIEGQLIIRQFSITDDTEDLTVVLEKPLTGLKLVLIGPDPDFIPNPKSGMNFKNIWELQWTPDYLASGEVTFVIKVTDQAQRVRPWENESETEQNVVQFECVVLVENANMPPLVE